LLAKMLNATYAVFFKIVNFVLNKRVQLRVLYFSSLQSGAAISTPAISASPSQHLAYEYRVSWPMKVNDRPTLSTSFGCEGKGRFGPFR